MAVGGSDVPDRSSPATPGQYFYTRWIKRRLMLQLRQYLCGIIGKPVTASRLGLADRVEIRNILPKSGVVKASFISDFFWNILQCSAFEPVSTGACAMNTDCLPGQECKEGKCLTNPANCINTGCAEHYECNASTGNCGFVPQCHKDIECNQIASGERCLGNICQKPVICIPGVDGMCAPTWTCVDRTCVKS